MKLKLSYDGQKILITFQYNSTLVYGVKQIFGREWHPLERYWTVPVSDDSLIKLEKLKFNTDSIKIDILDQKNDFDNKSMVLRTELKRDYPHLYDYQFETVAKSILLKNILICEDMGLGKTLESLTVVDYWKKKKEIKKMAIFCPVSIKEQWQREAKRWYDFNLVIVKGDKKQRLRCMQQDGDGWIFNYEQIVRNYTYISSRIKNNIVIFDEASYLKNEKAKRTIGIKKLDAKFKLALTGTPIETKLKDGYNITKLIKPDFMSKYAFHNNYCVYEKGYGGFSILIGYKNVDNFMDKLRRISIRHMKEDIKTMPGKIIYNRIIPLSIQQENISFFVKNELGKILKESVGNLIPQEVIMLPMVEDAVELIIESNSNIARKIKRQFDLKSDSNKLKELVEVDDELDDKKVLLFTRFKRMIPHIVRVLEKNGSKCLMGSSETKDRIGLIDNFRDGDAKYMVVTDAFSYGIDLPFATTVINFDMVWNHAKLKQREDRIYRITSKKQVKVINLIADGFEQYMFKRMRVGENLAEQFGMKKSIREYIIKTSKRNHNVTN